MENENSNTAAESNEDEHYKVIVGCGTGHFSSNVFPRRNASPGKWLCVLLPLAIASNLINISRCNEQVTTQVTLTIAAIGMCIESVFFFLCMVCKTSSLVKLILAFLPGLVTTLLYKVLLKQYWSYGIFLGFIITYCYQKTYIRVMRELPGCFSYGEAAVLVQGLMLFLLNTILKLPSIVYDPNVRSDFEELNIIMMCALLYLFAVCYLLSAYYTLRMNIYFYILLLLLAICVTCIPLRKTIPLFILITFVLKDIVRLKIIGFYLALVVFTVLIVWWQAGRHGKASTRARKLFHLLIVLVYVPGILYQCAFLYISSGVAFAVITILELVRICNIPPLAAHLREAFVSFSDEKDSGILALTPFCLLIGCSLPIWISPCPCDNSSCTSQIIQLLAGILTIGVGDTAASVVGSKFGRTKWCNSKKSVEGTLAFIVMILFSLLGLHHFRFITPSPLKWFMTAIATVTTALVEAHTNQIDNLTLPIIFYTIVNVS